MIVAAKTPTLRDIAEIVGVTPTTVSLALRDNPRISDKMRAAVKQTAEELGYQRNAELSRVMMKLKTSHNREIRPVVALVVEGASGSKVHEQIRQTFQAVTEEAGYAMDVIRMGEPRMSFERLGDILRARGIRGALLYRLVGTAPENSEWMEDLAFCCVGSALAGSKLPVCMWAAHAEIPPNEDLLFEAAMDLLDLQLQRHRFGAPDHEIRFTLS